MRTQQELEEVLAALKQVADQTRAKDTLGTTSTMIAILEWVLKLRQ